jgi:hypothetical protein
MGRVGEGFFSLFKSSFMAVKGIPAQKYRFPWLLRIIFG